MLNELRILGDFEPVNSVAEYWLGADSPPVQLVDDQIQAAIQEDKALSETEIDSLVKARRGQGKFRQNLMQIETKCRVSNITDKRLLIASHIKPWRACLTGEERLDGTNGLLLAPHIDRLFDIGLVSFEKNGNMLISASIDQHTQDCLGLSLALSAGVGEFSDAQENYLYFHREMIFRNE